MRDLNPKVISVPLKEKSYNIYFQEGLINFTDKLLSPVNTGQKWIIVSPKSISETYGSNIFTILKKTGFDVNILQLKEGEKVKSFFYYKKYINDLIKMGCNRDSVLISLGGGVTGDLCGFIASTLFRGIAYYQIPTSLLGMVDASIGGKTAINTKQGKNLIGTFYHPNAVLIDPKLLISLPKKEFLAGLCEIIKYGFIDSKKIIKIFKNFNFIDISSNNNLINDLILCSVESKSNIVSKDSEEKGLRKILNFGHTVGHIIESFTKYKKYTHGEAIAHGMIISLKISNKLFKLSKNLLEESIYILKKLCLKKPPKIPKKKFFQYLYRDKKIESKKINFILIKEIGKPIISKDVSAETIYKTYHEYTEDNE